MQTPVAAVLAGILLTSTIGVLVMYRDKVFMLPGNAIERADKPHYPQLRLSISILDQLQRDEPQKNIVYSPHSVYWTLFLAYFGAAGETEQELRNLLGLNWAKSKADIERVYKLKIERSNRFQNESITFSTIEKLFVSKTMKIRDSVKKQLNDSIEQLNIAAEPDQCTKYINHFVEEATKNQIKNLLGPSDITSKKDFIMVNAVHFHGQWAKVFNAKATHRDKFYKQNGEKVYVDMMSEISTFKCGYNEQLRARTLKLPYKGEHDAVSMFIFVPYSRDPTAFDELLEKSTADALDDVFSGAKSYSQFIHLTVPKFTLDKSAKLNKAIQSIGVQNLFANANFSGFFEETEKNYASQIIHKAKINVDEAGTTAAAATFNRPVQYSMYTPFYCDHPFMFIIHDKILNEILFAGIYHGPD